MLTTLLFIVAAAIVGLVLYRIASYFFSGNILNAVGLLIGLGVLIFALRKFGYSF